MIDSTRQQQLPGQHPIFSPYRASMDLLPVSGFPDFGDLNRIISQNRETQRYTFVDQNSLDDQLAYEQRVALRGQIATRPDNWHDLCNALVWSVLPRLKQALNALHIKHWGDGIRRSRVRDFCTLLDESGGLVFSTERALLEDLRNHQWLDVFFKQRSRCQQSIRFLACGHALLEKMLSPYKQMTAQCLLIQCTKLPTDNASIDRLTSQLVLDQEPTPEVLSPLPVMGLPGWSDAEQDFAFYNDQQCFRPGRQKPVPAPIFYAHN